MSIASAARKLITTCWDYATKSPQQRLGLPNDYPMSVFVYVHPEKFPPQEIEGCRFLAAKLQKDGAWKVEDLEDIPGLMDTGQACHGIETLTTEQMVAKFDAHMADYPNQNRQDQMERHFANVRNILLRPLPETAFNPGGTRPA